MIDTAYWKLSALHGWLDAKFPDSKIAGALIHDFNLFLFWLHDRTSFGRPYAQTKK